MKRAKPLSSIDPFLIWLTLAVIAATLLPACGAMAAAFGWLADIAIALLFFLHGAKLSREAIVQGMGNWRLHGLVLASTYVLFPALGLAMMRACGAWLSPLLGSGMLFLTLLPSTVQSSIAFTAMARGNVAAAVCSASLSNLLGIVLTPLLVGLLMQAGDHGSLSPLSSIKAIAVQLLLPFAAGHLLRPLISGFIDRNKAIFMPVDRGSILLVVYTAFSAAQINGMWTRVGWIDLLALFGISAVLLAIVMAANMLIAGLVKLPREDAIVLLFCGSKKSLVSGVPMAGALFAPGQVGQIVLPLMIFHQLQLVLCAAIAARFSREADLLDKADAATGKL